MRGGVTHKLPTKADASALATNASFMLSTWREWQSVARSRSQPPLAAINAKSLSGIAAVAPGPSAEAANAKV